MKKGSTKRALVTSIVSTCTCVTMLAGATFAWFTDTASTGVNKIQAGTLDIALLNEAGNSVEGDTLKWKTADGRSEILWEPGAKYDLETVKVVNKGNLALKYKVIITGIKGDAKLNEAIDWTINGEGIDEEQSLPVGETDEIKISGKMKTTAGNEYQDQSIEGIGITVVATQDTVESDTNGNQYDKDAIYSVATAEDLQEAINTAGEGNNLIVLGADINEDITVEQKAGTNITIDGNGNEFSGEFIIDGKSSNTVPGTLTISNVKFNATGMAKDTACINLGVSGNNNTRYTKNVVIENCTFEGVGNKVVAIKSYTGGDKNLTVKGCTVGSGMHSMMQVKNIEDSFKIIDCKVYSKNGVNVNNSRILEMTDCTFEVQGYAVRFGESANTTTETFTIKDSTLKSAIAEAEDAVIEFRAGAVDATLTLENTTLVGNPNFKGNTDATKIIIK